LSGEDRQKRLDAALAAARQSGGQAAVSGLMDELFQEQARYDRMLKAASDAALKAAPPEMPPIRDRDLGVGFGLVSCGVTYVFETDDGLARAQALKLTDWIADATRKELLAHGYPDDAIDALRVKFTTHEVIVREAGGDYHIYFQ
jgi:hypothetical protein